MDINSKRFRINLAVLFYIFLFLVRILDNDIFGNWENAHISQGLFGSWIWVAIKFSYWCIPILVYLLLKNNLVKFIKDRFAFKIRPAYSLLFIPLWFIVLLAEAHFRIPKASSTYFYIVTSVVTTPFIEEFVFRGFILSKLLEKYSFLRANLYQSLLFACIHLPYYYELGKFNNFPLLLGSLIHYLIYLVFFAYVSVSFAKTTKSLYPSIFLPTINNLLP